MLPLTGGIALGLRRWLDTFWKPYVLSVVRHPYSFAHSQWTAALGESREIRPPQDTLEYAKRDL